MITNAERVARELRHLLKKQGRVRATTIEHALRPLVTFALGRLQRRAPSGAKKIIAASAWRTLEKHLQKRLLFALGPTLRIEQIATKAVSRRSRAAGITLTDAFRAFPGLLQTAAHLLGAWIDAQRELLVRLTRDQTLLRKNFALVRRELAATAIRPGLSDPHHSGRSATLIEFSGKRRVIYKPRGCAGENFWFAALRWLDRNGAEFHFKIPKLLARRNYHWMEFLRPKACRSLTEVRSFYFRWGAQAALAQILHASDLHWENWIAAAAQPVLLDAELITPNEILRTRKRSQDRQLLSPLLQTGLVRLTVRDRAGFYEGIAPFDATIAETSALRCWPTYKRISRSPSTYVNELLDGFEAVAAIFAKAKLARNFYEEIILPAAPHETRGLFRPSAEYARILFESLTPDQMSARNKRKRWLFENCRASAVTRAVGTNEGRALFDCDIPKFSLSSRNPPISRGQFSKAIAQLKDASRLLRRRVLLGTRASKKISSR